MEDVLNSNILRTLETPCEDELLQMTGSASSRTGHGGLGFNMLQIQNQHEYLAKGNKILPNKKLRSPSRGSKASRGKSSQRSRSRGWAVNRTGAKKVDQSNLIFLQDNIYND